MSDGRTPTVVRIEAEFSAFYRAEHASQVHRAFLLLGDNEAANDVVHEAMTAVFQRWEQLHQPAAYLNRTVVNGCRDAGRRRSSLVRVLHRLREVEIGNNSQDSLSDVLAKLPFNHRAAMVLRYYAGYTTDEISAALGCAPGSVGPWIERGLAAMRKVL